MDIDAIQHMDEASMASLLPLHGIRIKFKRQHETWVCALSVGNNLCVLKLTLIL